MLRKQGYAFSTEELNQLFSDIVDLTTNKVLLPQTTHLVTLLSDEQLAVINDKFKIYQIIIEPEYYSLVAFLSIVKNNFEKVLNVSSLEKLISVFEKIHSETTSSVSEYHRLIEGKSYYKKLSFHKLYYPPYEDYISLYEELNNRSPDIKEYETRLAQAEMPRVLDILGVKIQVDIDNLTVKKL